MKPQHYYGNVVRSCFITISILLLGSMLMDKELLGLYLVIGVAGVVALVVLAGLTSPNKKRILYFETIIAGAGFIFFEYAAIIAFQWSLTFTDVSFLLRQALAILFLIALYYSTKTIREVNIVS